MSWIDDVMQESKDGVRDALMKWFMNTVNIYRLEGFHDVEIYHILVGDFEHNPANDKLKHWQYLIEYWCEVFLDWNDEPGGEDE